MEIQKMKFDLDFPQLELRLLIAILYRERLSNITQWLRIEFKIPWISAWYFIYKHIQLIEFATMPRKSCWRFRFLNKLRRDFYDAYPQVNNGKEIST
jgi:hypothetical protein